jgi:polyphenol oxidase
VLELYRQAIGSYTLHVVATERVDGDQRPDRDSSLSGCAARAGRQRSLTGFEWSMAAEEHGITVVDADRTVDAAVRDVSTLPPGDVLVTEQKGRALAVWAGDCAPLVLSGRNGTLVAAHAGWRGLATGVIDAAVAELTARGDQAAAAVLGPCIHAECYEFGSDELEAVTTGVGVTTDAISGTTRGGQQALDVPGAIAAALGRHGITLDVVGPCTACDERWFSHRARNEDGRHAVVAWTSAP